MKNVSYVVSGTTWKCLEVIVSTYSISQSVAAHCSSHSNFQPYAYVSLVGTHYTIVHMYYVVHRYLLNSKHSETLQYMLQYEK